MSTRALLLFILTLMWAFPSLADPNEEKEREQKHFSSTVRPILHGQCGDCHNAVDSKAGVNLVRFDFIVHIVQNGKLFMKVIDEIESGHMPPNTRPPLSDSEKDTLLIYLKKYLDDALAEPDPGLIPPRRLSNREYRYSVYDLLGVELNTDSLLPADASGGSGFDNQASTAYMSPLRLERYFELAEMAVEEVYADPQKWRSLVPAYVPTGWTRFLVWWEQVWNQKDISFEGPQQIARESISSFATLAYRKFLETEEQEQLMELFATIYKAETDSADRLDRSIKEVFKSILISPKFLYRQERDLPIEKSYPLTNFELATRLSYLIWSSIPDWELLQVAYLQDLHNPKILEAQTLRMLDDPRSARMAENFATQWLEIDKLKRPDFRMDPDKFPDYNGVLRDLMYEEVVAYFDYVFRESQNLLELLNSDYTFLNQQLADHYGLVGNFSEKIERTCLDSPDRGGLIGMGAVLTATSLPERTSPVLRGKWVLEQILGTPPPPPPPDVPELETAQGSHDDLGLRKLLELHRADPACAGCHKDMDAIGLGLENFDALGKWRNTYQNQVSIDPHGRLKSGEEFAGPGMLKEVLEEKKALFAQNFSERMLSYSVGRSVGFYDSPTTHKLRQVLLETDFHSVSFLLALVNSFPFRHKKTEPEYI
ncbi:MAG: DUF1592 domain-containing protein [Bacteroidota bacterium]